MSHVFYAALADKRLDEILRLRAENEKLRAALKPFADIAKQTEHWSGPPVSVPLYVIRAAAAALKETGE